MILVEVGVRRIHLRLWLVSAVSFPYYVEYLFKYGMTTTAINVLQNFELNTFNLMKKIIFRTIWTA